MRMRFLIGTPPRYEFNWVGLGSDNMLPTAARENAKTGETNGKQAHSSGFGNFRGLNVSNVLLCKERTYT